MPDTLKIPDKYQRRKIEWVPSYSVRTAYNLAIDPKTDSAVGVVNKKTGEEGFLTNNDGLVTHGHMMLHGDDGPPPVCLPGKLPR